MADRIALMRAGRIVQEGPPFALYNEPVDKQAAMFFSDVNVVARPRRRRRGRDALRPLSGAGPRRRRRGRGRHPAAARQDRLRPGGQRTPADRRATACRCAAASAAARFVGNQSLVELALDHDGSVLKATLPGVFLPRAGNAAVGGAPPRPLLRLRARRDRSRRTAHSPTDRRLRARVPAGAHRPQPQPAAINRRRQRGFAAGGTPRIL